MTGQSVRLRLTRLLKVVLLSLLFVFIVLILVATVRTISLDVNTNLKLAKWERTEHIPPNITSEYRERFISNFKEAIRIPTVSFSETNLNTTALDEFYGLMRKAFPALFSSHLVLHEVVANYSHLFWVPGTDLSLQPYMLLAHIDVVPANEDDGWDAPPFSAKEIDGFIYGRGTIDNKQSVMGILEALEFLLARSYMPTRGFYVGLGHDEEVSGLNGAVNIVKALKERGVELEFVLDEGLAVLDGIISGLQGPAALIGISEKGAATVKLSVTTPTGHSSMPPPEGSIGILAAAIKRLEDNPMPRLFGEGPERGTFEHLAQSFGLPLRFIMSNLWLFSPLLSRVMERRPDTNAFVRTTTAITMFNAGVKVNVLPSHAEAVVNLRIHSAQSLQEVLDLIEATVADERVKIELLDGFDPLPVSSYSSKAFGYQVIKRTVQDMFPQVAIAPGVCVGNTDSRHYTDLTKEIYRFAPTWFKPGDPKRFHGVNERISIKNYEELIVFYIKLFQNCDIRDLPSPHSAGHEL